MKKLRLGAGRWNGFGGKLEEGETIEAAARREVREEAGIDVDKIEKYGKVEFSWKGKDTVLEVHVFKATKFVGKPSESDEMRPQWFHVDEIPYDQMWSSDPYWFPLVLQGKRFVGKFVFDSSDKVLEHEVKEKTNL